MRTLKVTVGDKLNGLFGIFALGNFVERLLNSIGIWNFDFISAQVDYDHDTFEYTFIIHIPDTAVTYTLTRLATLFSHVEAEYLY